MKILGTVVQLKLNTTMKNKAGKDYPGCKLVYEDKDGDIKNENMHENAYKYNDSLKNGLDNLKEGDKFTMVKEKENDFWNVKNIFGGWEEETQTKTATSSSTTKKATTSGSSTSYPTKEERDVTQGYIIRQSSISSAVNASVALKLKSVSEILAAASRFEAFVMTGVGEEEEKKRAAPRKQTKEPVETEEEVPDDEEVE